LSTEIHNILAQKLKNLGTVIAIIPMGYSDDLRRVGFAVHAQRAHTNNYKSFGLSYLDKTIHGGHRRIHNSSRPAPLL
jgi:hypothetical protein